MKKTLYTLLLSTFVASTAYAGGPVVIEERYDTEVEGSQAGVHPAVIVGALIVACLILCGDKDKAPVAAPAPLCNGDC